MTRHSAKLKNLTKLIVEKFIFFPALLLLPLGSQAQSGKFSVGVAAGLNFAPLNGEEIIDYFGLNAGLKGAYRVNENFGLGTELLFSQNAEYGLPEFYPNITYQNVRLNFIEIPVQAEWFVFPAKTRSPSLTCGLAYSRLLSFYVENTEGEDVSDSLIWQDQQTGVNALVGVLLPFSEGLAFNLRLARSLSYSDLSATLSLRLIWTFI